MRARNLLIGLLFLMGVGLAASPATAGLEDLGAAFGPLMQERAPDVIPDVDVDINRTERVVWYTNPWVIAGAVIAVILVVALIARGGGGTTVVKG